MFEMLLKYLGLCCEDLWFVSTVLKAVLMLDSFGGVKEVLGKSGVGGRGGTIFLYFTPVVTVYYFLLSQFSILAYLLQSGLSHMCFPFLCLPLFLHLPHLYTENWTFQLGKRRGKY